MDNADVEDEDRYFVTDPNSLGSLLNVEQATSADYHTIKSLVRGEVDSWMGFKWIKSTRVSAVTSLSGLAFQKYGLCLAMAAQPLVRTDERTDLSYSWQIYYELNVGATRLEEDRCLVLYAAS